MRETLEANILANRDSVENHLVYADWLCDQGDPRGEFIHVQLQLENETLSSDARRQLLAREDELLDEHLPEWLGSLQSLTKPRSPPQDNTTEEPISQGFLGRVRNWFSSVRDRFVGDYNTYISYSFDRGLLHTLSCPFLTVEQARVLAHEPECRWLRSLEIISVGWDESLEDRSDIPDNVDQPSLFPLLHSPHLEGLTSLAIGESLDLNAKHYNCFDTGEGVAELVQGLPNLVDLRLGCHHADTEAIFKMNLQRLRNLQLFHGYEYPLPLLAQNESLRHLERLAIMPHAVEPGEEPSIDTNDLRAIAGSECLSSLQALHLRLHAMGDESARILVDSTLWARLEELDLSYGNMTDNGAEILIDALPRSALKKLNLTCNALTPAGVERLESTGLDITAELQHGGDEWLIYGDIE